MNLKNIIYINDSNKSISYTLKTNNMKQKKKKFL